MKKILFVCFLMIYSCAYTYGTLQEKIPESATTTHFTFSDSNIIPQNVEIIKKLAESAKEQENISVKDTSSLQSSIKILIQDKFMTMTVAERQKLVKKTIGEETYLTLDQVFLKMLSSNNLVQQSSALTSLGFPLFDINAIEEIKKFVFHENREIQLMAIESLVYLDLKGADYLLCNVVLADILPDYQEASAIDALYRTNNKDLEKIAPSLLVMNIGGGTFKSLLPVLKKSKDFNKILADLFKSNKFSIPEKSAYALEEYAKLNAESSLLVEIDKNPVLFMSDEVIKKKVIMYANSNIANLSVESLVILEKSGQDLKFFTEMLKDTKITEQKKRALNYIISRIQKGERLK
jgi:hypothetical protein